MKLFSSIYQTDESQSFLRSELPFWKMVRALILKSQKNKILLVYKLKFMNLKSVRRSLQCITINLKIRNIAQRCAILRNVAQYCVTLRNIPEHCATFLLEKVAQLPQ